MFSERVFIFCTETIPFFAFQRGVIATAADDCIVNLCIKHFHNFIALASGFYLLKDGIILKIGSYAHGK